ncbi:VanZ family protein [Flavobacterium daejeonense]|uniref:VanZ family protein n=1 Tax=Flavobacterium daejeonense TaxID=350893 RepID=UPI0005586259|nr:VanZ family protein [Flavobacterium daejeonense]
MLKKICLGAALAWTGNIIYLCLIKASELPQITIPYIDKYVHAIFHFVFSLLWFYAFRFSFKMVHRVKLLSIVFVMSLVFGIAIELFQTYLMVTRNGDAVDVLANSTGALLAILTIQILNKKFNCK